MQFIKVAYSQIAGYPLDIGTKQTGQHPGSLTGKNVNVTIADCQFDCPYLPPVGNDHILTANGRDVLQSAVAPGKGVWSSGLA